MLHKPITHLRILSDGTVIRVPDESPFLEFACGEEVPLVPHGREPEAEIVCKRCAKERGYKW